MPSFSFSEALGSTWTAQSAANSSLAFVGSEEGGRGVPGFMTRLGPVGMRVLLVQITHQTSHPCVSGPPQDRSPTHSSFLLKLGSSVEESDSSPYTPSTLGPEGWVTNCYSKSLCHQCSRSRSNTPGLLISPSLASFWDTVPSHHIS